MNFDGHICAPPVGSSSAGAFSPRSDGGHPLFGRSMVLLTLCRTDERTLHLIKLLLSGGMGNFQPRISLILGGEMSQALNQRSGLICLGTITVPFDVLNPGNHDAFSTTTFLPHQNISISFVPSHSTHTVHPESQALTLDSQKRIIQSAALHNLLSAESLNYLSICTSILPMSLILHEARPQDAPSIAAIEAYHSTLPGHAQIFNELETDNKIQIYTFDAELYIKHARQMHRWRVVVEDAATKKVICAAEWCLPARRGDNI